MSRPKTLTRKQKIAVTAYGLNHKYYLFDREINESYFWIIHKEKNKRMIIDMYAKPNRRA